MSQNFIPIEPENDGSEEVPSDAMQLLNVATFNGLCRVISALAANGMLDPSQLESIHDAVTAPLDDPDWRDDSFIAHTRRTLENVLAEAMKHSHEHWERK